MNQFIMMVAEWRIGNGHGETLQEIDWRQVAARLGRKVGATELDR